MPSALQDAGSWGTGGCGDGPPGAGEGPGDPSQGPPPPGLAELELSWETEKEEKRLLQEQLQCTQVSPRTCNTRVLWVGSGAEIRGF